MDTWTDMREVAMRLEFEPGVDRRAVWANMLWKR